MATESDHKTTELRRGITRHQAVVGVLMGVSAASHWYVPVFTLKYFGMLAPAIAISIAGVPREYYLRHSALGVTILLFAIGWMQRVAPMVVSRRFIFW